MRQITAKELEASLKAGNEWDIIDVREVEEVKNGKIASAINIPLGLLEFRLHELDKSKEFVIVCHSGGRSRRASQFLETRGFQVMNMDGGMLAWEGEVE